MVGTTDHDLLVGVSVPRGSLYASIMQPGKHIAGRATRALPAAIILAKGAECREQTHSSVCGEEFSLDIPFYRTRPAPESDVHGGPRRDRETQTSG